MRKSCQNPLKAYDSELIMNVEKQTLKVSMKDSRPLRRYTGNDSNIGWNGWNEGVKNSLFLERRYLGWSLTEIAPPLKLDSRADWGISHPKSGTRPVSRFAATVFFIAGKSFRRKNGAEIKYKMENKGRDSQGESTLHYWQIVHHLYNFLTTKISQNLLIYFAKTVWMIRKWKIACTEVLSRWNLNKSCRK